MWWTYCLSCRKIIYYHHTMASIILWERQWESTYFLHIHYLINLVHDQFDHGISLNLPRYQHPFTVALFYYLINCYYFHMSDLTKRMYEWPSDGCWLQGCAQVQVLLFLLLICRWDGNPTWPERSQVHDRWVNVLPEACWYDSGGCQKLIDLYNTFMLFLFHNQTVWFWLCFC